MFCSNEGYFWNVMSEGYFGFEMDVVVLSSLLIWDIYDVVVIGVGFVGFVVGCDFVVDC